MTFIRLYSRTDTFFALIADVVESRRVADRAGLQRRLLALLEALNHRHGPALAAPLALVGGDELQGLFQDGGALVPVILALEEALHPVRVVVGIGRGGITTDLLPDVGALDGPSFHRAREALNAVRGEGGWVGMKGLGGVTDRLVTATFTLVGILRGRWTETQRRYALASRHALQREVAERFGVAESTLSESLRASRAGAVREAEEALAAFLAGAEVGGDGGPEGGGEVGEGGLTPEGL